MLSLENSRIDKSYKTMIQAIIDAGGCADSFTYDNLKKMTAFELVKTLGTNNIQFMYIKQGKK